jgi:hypothetical protein
VFCAIDHRVTTVTTSTSPLNFDSQVLFLMQDVRESVRHSKIHKEKFNKMQKCIKILLFHIYMKLYMLWGDIPSIIRSLKPHWQLLVFYTWKVVGRVVGRRCQAQCA